MNEHRLLASLVIAFGTVCLSADLLTAQALEPRGLRLEGRAGIANHGAAGCGHAHVTEFTVGVDVRTGGTWILAAALDLIGGAVGCLDLVPVRTYAGQIVEAWGRPGVDPPLRPSVGAGYVTNVLGFVTDVTAGAGLLPTVIAYRPPDKDFGWRPWFGGSLTTRVPGSRAGLQLELGRHQLAERYYVLDQDAVLAEIHRWETTWRLGLTVPLFG
jgi:hypothetical protein